MYWSYAIFYIRLLSLGCQSLEQKTAAHFREPTCWHHTNTCCLGIEPATSLRRGRRANHRAAARVSTLIFKKYCVNLYPLLLILEGVRLGKLFACNKYLYCVFTLAKYLQLLHLLPGTNVWLDKRSESLVWQHVVMFLFILRVNMSSPVKKVLITQGAENKRPVSSFWGQLDVIDKSALNCWVM